MLCRASLTGQTALRKFVRRLNQILCERDRRLTQTPLPDRGCRAPDAAGRLNGYKPHKSPKLGNFFPFPYFCKLNILGRRAKMQSRYGRYRRSVHIFYPNGYNTKCRRVLRAGSSNQKWRRISWQKNIPG